MDLDQCAGLEEPFRDTAAYRIGSQVHRHETRIELIEYDLRQLHDDQDQMKITLKEFHEHCNRFEAEVNLSQRKLLGFIILTLLSATGGLIVLTVQSYLALKS